LYELRKAMLLSALFQIGSTPFKIIIINNSKRIKAIYRIHRCMSLYCNFLTWEGNKLMMDCQDNPEIQEHRNMSQKSWNLKRQNRCRLFHSKRQRNPLALGGSGTVQKPWKVETPWLRKFQI
jgi:hypothetical protein